MAIFISAGHNSKSKTIKQDPGAVNSKGIKEGDLTIEYRDLVCKELDKLKVPYVKDSDEENLSMYLKRIQTGNASVVVEFHFDAASPSATGVTALVGDDSDRLDKAFAKELADSTALAFGIKNRGIISESQSHRGRLGLMREQGIVALLELGFITNDSDLSAYHKNKLKLAQLHAQIIKKYEDLIK